jgi:hypothetical protein
MPAPFPLVANRARGGKKTGRFYYHKLELSGHKLFKFATNG